MPLATIVRIILGLLFAIAAALKLPNLKGFSVIVASYGILPRKLVKPAAYLQPFAELLVGIMLLLGKQLFYASLGALLLMITADIFTIFGLINKKKLENCGCYGANIKIPLTWKKVVENLIWTVLCLYLVITIM